MRNLETRVFSVTDEVTTQQIRAALEDGFGVREEPPSRRSVTFYETFDWRLHRAGIELTKVREGRIRRLVAKAGDRSVEAPAPSGELALTDSLPEPLREVVAPALGIRALLPLAIVDADVVVLSLLDDEDKTVCRVRVEDCRRRAPRRRGGVQETLIRLLPVRGYDRAVKKAAKILAGMLGTKPAPSADLAQALDAVGRVPGDYTSKPKVELEADERTDQAVRRLLAALLEVMVANESGTKADHDTEFLHDLRVAVRRTRSALSQVKQTFPARELNRFRRFFAWLGQVTGPCRDLDVHLLVLDDEAQAHPEEREVLAPLASHLVAAKKREHKKLVRALESDRYRRTIAAWRSFLEADAPESTRLDNAARPVTEVARERIWKAYRRVVRRGRQVTDETPVEVLHRLRIDGKKLRYLLELFSTLFPADRLGRLIKELKRLQENLGDLNDCAVQRDALRSAAADLVSASEPPSDTLLAMGVLVGRIDERERVQRELFRERFERFDRKANRKAFRRLFRGPLVGSDS